MTNVLSSVLALFPALIVQPPAVSGPKLVIYHPSFPHTADNNCLCDKLCYFFVPQISELSDLADRPLVGALTSRLQALHTQLQAFVEQVDNLGKPPAGGRDPQVEGASPLASPCTSLPCSGDGQDGVNTAEEKVKDKKHTPPFHSLSLCLFHLFIITFFQAFTFNGFLVSVITSLFFYFSVLCLFQRLTISLAELHSQSHLNMLL